MSKAGELAEEYAKSKHGSHSLEPRPLYVAISARDGFLAGWMARGEDSRTIAQTYAGLFKKDSEGWEASAGIDREIARIDEEEPRE